MPALLNISKHSLQSPFQDQLPGTSGLRKRVKVFQQPHYTESFITSILATIPDPNDSLHTLVLGGDGRFYTPEVCQIIVQIAAASKKFKCLIIGQNGILSTPAASHLIRKNKAIGGILLTASHNPGGPNADFGIKFNGSNGGPAPQAVTDAIFEHSKKLKEYQIATNLKVDLSKLGTVELVNGFEVHIIDPVTDYIELMQELFDFPALRSFLSNSTPKFTVLVDAMHGVTGPYLQKIFIDLLHLPPTSVMNASPLQDFGGLHPDPNLTYAKELVDRVRTEKISFGAASDGDGDRNMILSHDAFVSPSDSVAVIAHWAIHAIPYFKRTGIRGVARSMPTSQSLDLVAKRNQWTAHEVPTGWKFFGNLMDAGQLSICGEESFGTGSDHIREKDGIWAMLAWLQILSFASTLPDFNRVSVYEILSAHWKTYGRHYYTRYDYEDVDASAAKQLMQALHTKLTTMNPNTALGDFVVAKTGDFSYHDPIDHSVTNNQGLFVTFTTGSRFVFRLSGTGSQGATIRLYAEAYNDKHLDLDPQQALAQVVALALNLSQLQKFTGRIKPTVIT